MYGSSPLAIVITFATMRSVSAVAIALVVAVILAIVATRIWAPLLTDLAQTRDDDLRYLNRRGWAVAIVAVFPIGAIAYVKYAKGPNRYG
jgi:hypothetical protein